MQLRNVSFLRFLHGTPYKLISAPPFYCIFGPPFSSDPLMVESEAFDFQNRRTAQLTTQLVYDVSHLNLTFEKNAQHFLGSRREQRIN